MLSIEKLTPNYVITLRKFSIKFKTKPVAYK